MQVRLFRLYGATECQRIAQQTGTSLAAWSKDWLPAAELKVTFRNVTGAEDAVLSEIDTESQLLVCSDSQCLIIVMMRGKPAGLLQLLPVLSGARGVDTELERRVQSDVAARCARDLSGCLPGKEQTQLTGAGGDLPVGTVQYAAVDLPEPGKDFESLETELRKADRKALAPLFQPGSGWGVLTLSCESQQLRVLLGPGCLLQQVDSSYPPGPRGGLAEGYSALTGKPIALSAELGNTTLTIGDLENLAVGDVIRLDQPCDAPVQLRVVNGLYLAEGQLGSLAESKAVKLLPKNGK